MNEFDEAILDAGLEFAHEQIAPKPSYPFQVAQPIANVVLICWSQAHIDNGGLAYFFEMQAPGSPPYSAFYDAYRDIGAPVTADCIEESVKKFPFEDVHLDAELRRESMYPDDDDGTFSNHMFDEINKAIFEDDVWQKLTQYIIKHRNIFLN